MQGELLQIHKNETAHDIQRRPQNMLESSEGLAD
jgi:hypothetical protein